MKMICGFYNIRPYTPVPLVVITKDDSDNHHMVYPDGHLEELTVEEYHQLEPEFVQTEQKKIWDKEPLKTQFVLLPDNTILAGTNAEVGFELIRWYKSSKKEMDESTRSITEKYVSFLLDKLAKNDSELKNVRESMLSLFVWFLNKTKNIELAEWFEQLATPPGCYRSPVSVVVSGGVINFQDYMRKVGKMQSKMKNQRRKIFPGSIELNEENLRMNLREDGKVKTNRRNR